MYKVQKSKNIDLYASISFYWIRTIYDLDKSLEPIAPNSKPMRVTYFTNKHKITDNVKSAAKDRFVIYSNKKFISMLREELTIFVRTLIFSIISIIVLLNTWGKRVKSDKIKDVILQPKEANKILKKLKQCSHLKIDDLHLVKDSENKHILITGSTGSGKTTLMHKILPQIRSLKQKAIIIDQTGEMVEKYYDKEKDVILNPRDELSFTWDFMNEAKDKDILDTIASTIYSKPSNDDVWNASSKTLFIDSVNYINSINGSVDDLYNFLTKSDLDSMYKALTGTASSKLINPKSDKTSFSVLMNTVSYLDFLKTLILNNKSSITIDSFIKGENEILFLSCSPLSRTISKSLFTVITDLSVMLLMNLGIDKTRRFWFVMDELASLKSLPVLTTALSELRKYGGCVIAGIQTISQLYDIYGTNKTNTITSQFNTKFFFKNSDKLITQLLSDEFGETEKIETTESLSYGAHEMRDGVNVGSIKKDKKIITHDMLSGLKPLECFVSMPNSIKVKMKLKV
jgi:type IV conjugative transfer system coupling protein TraD